MQDSFYLLVADTCADTVAFPTAKEAARYMSDEIPSFEHVLIIKTHGLDDISARLCWSVQDGTESIRTAMLREFQALDGVEHPDNWPEPHIWIADEVAEMARLAEIEAEEEARLDAAHKEALSDPRLYV